MEEIEQTEELKARIALNRQNALKRKFEVAEAAKEAELALADDNLSCQCVIDPAGSLCGAQPVAKDLLLSFGESCCEECRHLSDDWGLINKTDVASQFLIPQDSIKMMKFTTKINPRNSAFAPMKLYLRKHAMEKSFKRWGDRDGLLRELDRREKERFDRGLADCENALELGRGDDVLSGLSSSEGGCSSVTELLSSASGGHSASTDIADEQEVTCQKPRGRKAKVSSASQKRSAQLGKMMLAIRSDPKDK